MPCYKVQQKCRQEMMILQLAGGFLPPVLCGLTMRNSCALGLKRVQTWKQVSGRGLEKMAVFFLSCWDVTKTSSELG